MLGLTAVLFAALVFAATASAAGSVWTWGANTRGVLGDGTFTGPQKCGAGIGACSPSPVAVLNASTGIAGGYRHSLAVRGGRAYAWGDNTFGELGNGAAKNYSKPIQVHGLGNGKVLTGVVAVAAGLNFSLALRSDGTVVAWGENEFGQLGDGTSTGPTGCHGFACSTRPVLVSGLSNVRAIAAGGSHALALLNDGTMMAWGANDAGQLGYITSTGPDTCYAGTPCSTTPVQVTGASGGPIRPASSIAAGDAFSAAVVGSLEQVDTWGSNAYGQLGDGSTTGPSTCFNGEPCKPHPSTISNLIDISTVAANGDAHQMLALRPYDGAVIAWGDNEFGQVGTGCSTKLCPNPILETGISNPTELATSCGSNECRSLALESGGQVVEWGSAPLGDGSALGPTTCVSGSCSPSPVNVTGMDAASAIAAGGVHSLALAPPPGNRFGLRRAHCGACQVLTLKVHIPAPGALLAFQKPTPHQASVVDARARALVRRVKLNVTRAGTVRLKLRLTRAGKRALRRQGTLRLKILVTYTPNGGTPASKTIRVVFGRRHR